MPRSLPVADGARFRLLERLPIRPRFRGALWEVARCSHSYHITFASFVRQIEPPGKEWGFVNGECCHEKTERMIYETGILFEFQGTVPRQIVEQLVKEGRTERVA